MQYACWESELTPACKLTVTWCLQCIILQPSNLLAQNDWKLAANLHLNKM